MEHIPQSSFENPVPFQWSHEAFERETGLSTAVLGVGIWAVLSSSGRRLICENNLEDQRSRYSINITDADDPTCCFKMDSFIDGRRLGASMVSAIEDWDPRLSPEMMLAGAIHIHERIMRKRLSYIADMWLEPKIAGSEETGSGGSQYHQYWAYFLEHAGRNIPFNDPTEQAQAARSTWLGQQVLRHGFTIVEWVKDRSDIRMISATFARPDPEA